MENESLYLFNPPENADTSGMQKVQRDRLNAVFDAPLTEDDIAFKVHKATSEGRNPNLSFDEFRLYDSWHHKQEIKWWDTIVGGIGGFFGDVGSGLATLQPFGEGHSTKEAALNLTTRLGPTTTEALGRGTRDLVGLYQEASKSGNSPLYRLFNPNGDIYNRFVDFNKLADWHATSQRIVEGKENVILPDSLLPNTSGMIGQDVSSLSPERLFAVNSKLAQAGSYFLDPVTIMTLGGGLLTKSAAKTAMSSVMEGVSKTALKEGITGAESAVKNTASILDKGKIFGSNLTEKLGKSFRMAGEVVDRPISWTLEQIKTHASELLDANVHTTPSANIRITGPLKGQAGFGGSLMAGLGLGVVGVPYAATVVPIWAVANASKIGGAFFETLGKEMANGAGVLGRMGLEQTSTGKLARTFSKWGPMGSYVVEMTKAVAKSGAYGAAIGYVANGEEGAAQGVGVGMSIGTTHYHFGLAHNMFKGTSKEAMTAGLITNISQYRQNGFTAKSDSVLKYLSDIHDQHGEDAYYRNLGTYLAAERDKDVALSIWQKADFLRLRDDPTVPDSVRNAINDVIKADGNSWNGMFLQRNGKSAPYFIHKDAQSGKTHIIINAWATDISGKTQATGLKGEFYHAMADAYKEAADKPKFIHEIYDGIARTLSGNHTPESRTRLAQFFRHAADNLRNIGGGDIKFSRGLPSRVLNHIKLMNEQAPNGWEVVHVAGDDRINTDGFERPRYRWISRDEKGNHSGYDIYEGSDGKFSVLKHGKTISKGIPTISEALATYRKESYTPTWEPTTQGEAPPNVSGERTQVTPEPVKVPEPKDTAPSPVERAESVYRAIDRFEKDGVIDGDKFHVLLEELGESIWDAHESEQPFDYIYLAGDLGFARNLIEEAKHRISRVVDRNGRQAGFVPDFTKPFVEWFKDKDGKAIVDPYMRQLFKKFLRVHKERSMNLDGYKVDVNAFSPAMLKKFVEDNGIEHEFNVDGNTGNYVRKPEQQINAESHKVYQAASLDLLEAEKNGIITGFDYYASEKDTPNVASLDTENENGALFQKGWEDYRTSAEDIQKAQKRGTIPTKEELEALVQRTGIWGNRNRPRTGEIDGLIATAKKGSIIFTGIPTAEGFKILQKHLPKKQMEAIAKIAPLILDGGITLNNVTRVKYAGFTHSPETGPQLKKPKNSWSAVEKNMVFHSMELRATLRNPKSGKFDYAKPHAAFLLRGVDIDVLQRRIQWMWKNERETAKRWSNYVEFEKDVYRLIENYSAKRAIGGTNFFGGGAEGKAKKRLACAAVGAFPSKSMLEGIDADGVEFDVPEIDWHHYQFRSYGKGNAGRDIPWTNIRADAIREVYGTNDTLRVPYTERAYYRAQELFQPSARRGARDNEDVPANLRTISQELKIGPNQKSTRKFDGTIPLTSDWMYGMNNNYAPSAIIKAIRDGSVEMGPHATKNAKEYIKGGIGHDEATDSALVFWHGYGADQPFEHITMGQFGLHFGTRETALVRNYKMGYTLQIPESTSYNNLLPLITNIKKALPLADRGSWSGLNVAESILSAFHPDQRELAHTNTFESAQERSAIRDVIQTFTPADRLFLADYVARQKSLKVTAQLALEAQAELFNGRALTPRFKEISKQVYSESQILHEWLRTKGVDGIKYFNAIEGKAWSYIAFDGKSVKRLVANSGEYSPNDISMLHQQAATYGSQSAEQLKSLRANYEQAIKEGDIFKSIGIKNFLRGLPDHTVIARQMADEAMKQGVSMDEYNAQFKTGKPAVFPAVHATDSQVVAREGMFDPYVKERGRKLSQGYGVWFASHMNVGKYFREGREYLTRALIKTQNPLVVNAQGNHYSSKELGMNRWISKAKSAGHDSLILLNMIDDATDNDGKPLAHNQIVVFPEHANENIAVIDNDIRKRPVPRGLGLVNDAPVELPFLQQSDDANKGNEEVKRTFYSAVEKFVQEKVTDKTSLQEILGLLDPTRGTGIVKSELEFLDIAGWVEEQKKLNPSTKAKVDKAALLKYINEHKFELQEDKTNTAWYTLQGMDPNNPAVQSQVEGGYESYAPANKGEDELHPSTNYRVLLLRAPKGADYSGGEGGHFTDHENIIAFARVSDVYLDRATEMPSPLKNSNETFESRFFSKDWSKTATAGMHGDKASFVSTLDKLSKDVLRIRPLEIEQIPSTELVKKLIEWTGDMYSDGTKKPSEEALTTLGFTFDYLSGSNPEAALKIAQELKSIITSNFQRKGTFQFMADYRIDKLTKTIEKINSPDFDLKTWSVSSADFALFREVFKDPLGDSPSSGFFQPDEIKRTEALVQIFDLLKSLINPLDLEVMDELKSKKKMLQIIELQSDTAQKMQGRNDAKTAGIRTPQDQIRIQEVVKRIEEINQELLKPNATFTESELYKLREERYNLIDERAKIANKKDKRIISSRELQKDSNYHEIKKQIEAQFDQFEFLKFFLDSQDVDRPHSVYWNNAIDDILIKMFPHETDSSHAEAITQARKELEMSYKSIANEIAINIKDVIYQNGKFTDFEIHIDKMLSLYEQSVAKYFAGITDMPSKENPAERPWAEVFETALSDETSVRYDEMRKLVFKYLKYKLNNEYGAPGNIDYRYSSRKLAIEQAVSSGAGFGGDMVVTEFMPFLRTEDFSKLMFKKLLKEMVDGGYEGIILIPAELPQKLTGGDSKYYYGKILPKVMEGYTKKFGGKLRENKSISGYKQDPLFDIIGHYLKEEAKDPNYGYASKAYDASLQAAKVWISAGDDAKLQQDLRDRVTTNKMKYGLTKEQAEQVFDYFVQVVSGMRPESQKSWGIKDGTWTGDGDAAKQASRRGLILDRTPQMDAIKEGQPLWQAAPKRKVKGQPETIGDLEGKVKPQADRSIGEREDGIPIQSVPKPTAGQMNGTDLYKKLVTEGSVEYRGYKIVYDKANGGYKMFNPAGKPVDVPVAYIDKITGEQVIKMEKHVVFPYEAGKIIDKQLGGSPVKEGETQQQKLQSPAKVVKTEERAVAQVPVGDDTSAIESQVKQGKVADYYGMFKVGFDTKMNKYYALDNGGQQVSLIVPSQFQSGPRTMSGYYHPDLASVLQQLDKKFDKAKYASKSPSMLATPKETTPVATQEPVVAPQAPRQAPKPEPRRVEASSVPKAVRDTTPKPTSAPVKKPKASIPQQKPVAVSEPASTPTVVMPEEKPVQIQATEVVAPTKAVPEQITPDNEYLVHQAKALGKGFIEMLKDPSLKQYLLDSLNRDDNLTLKGTSEDASTADGRFSVRKKGKKLEVVQNNYESPITGLKYDKRPIAYVNTIQQAQIVIRRLELERTVALASRNMKPENGLAVMAMENPAFEEHARQKAIMDNALIKMLLSMRDNDIIPIMIDPVTLKPLLVMLPSEPAISLLSRADKKTQIAGALPENSSLQEKMPLAIYDKAITWNMFEEAEIKGLDYNTKIKAQKFRNQLGYEILKVNGKFRLFNPMKTGISVRDDEDAVMNDIISDIHRNGLRK